MHTAYGLLSVWPAAHHNSILTSACSGAGRRNSHGRVNMTTTSARFVTASLVAATWFGFFATDVGRAETPLVAGSKALLFQASSDIRLSGFSGGTVSWKHHTSPAGAWRIGLTTSASTFTEDLDIADDYDTSQSSWLRENDQDNLALSIALERLHYLNTERRISLYYGLGPSLSASRRTQNYRDSRDDFQQQRENVTNSIGIGVGVVLGVECFPHSQIGILGEYNSGLTYSWSKTETTMSSSTSPDRSERMERNQFEFRSGSVRLGISIYW